jgi:hypothetical protein
MPAHHPPGVRLTDTGTLVIYDPDNPDAWLESDVFVSLEDADETGLARL